MKAITTNEGAIKLHLNEKLIRTVPKGSFTTQIDWKRESVVISMNGTTTYYDFPLGTTIDGNDPGTLEDLADALSAFSRGGTEPGGDGVQSVTGDLVDNTNPLNPKINMPVLDDGEFLVGGASGNEQRKILPTDIGLTADNTVAVRNSNGDLQGWAMSSSADNSTIPVRTPTGQGKFSPGTANEDAVVVSQLNESLQDVVKSVDGTIPESLLPSYVDNVQEGTLATFPNPGMSNIVYLDTETNKAYRWGGSSYVEINSGGVAIGETSATAYRGDRGKEAYEHISDLENPHAVTASQVGLGNVDNTSDVDKPMSTATKTYVDSFVGKAWIPDYTNMETTNRITSSGGSWTSDRKGFVYVLSRGYNASIYNTVVVTINGKEVGKVWVEATSGTGTARSGSFSNIYPVKPGDVVTVIGNLEVKCLFIPGILV